MINKSVCLCLILCICKDSHAVNPPPSHLWQLNLAQMEYATHVNTEWHSHACMGKGGGDDHELASTSSNVYLQ